MILARVRGGSKPARVLWITAIKRGRLPLRLELGRYTRDVGRARLVRAPALLKGFTSVEIMGDGRGRGCSGSRGLLDVPLRGSRRRRGGDQRKSTRFALSCRVIDLLERFDSGDVARGTTRSIFFRV